jgi:chromosome segregation ATPase
MEEIKTIKQELTAMDHRLNDMEETIDSIDKKLTQVVEAILGNPLTQQGGFVKDITQLEDRINKLEEKQEKYDTFRNKVVWTTMILLGLGYFLKEIIEIYSYLKDV